MAEANLRTAADLPATFRAATSMTPNEMRALKEATGRRLTELIVTDPNDVERMPDMIQSLLWIALRRAGFDITWEQAGDVMPDQGEAPVDPMSAVPSMPSLGSVGTGA